MDLLKLKGLILWIQKRFLRTEIFLNPVRQEEEIEPVFIIGAPRTGSTLLFQLLLLKFRLGYISNLMALAPMFISRIARLFKKKILNYNTLKKSDYGVISGLHAPNEAAKVNDFWFMDNPKEEVVQSVRNSIYRTSLCLQSPLLIKSMGNALRLEKIVKIFPKARFIHIKRDPLYTGQSILLARKKLTGSYNEWWSLKPDLAEEVSTFSDPFYQVMWQIKTIDEKVNEDLERLSAPYLSISYKELCSETGKVLDKIGQHFHLETKAEKAIPPETNFSETIRLTDEEWQKLTIARDIVFDH